MSLLYFSRIKLLLVAFAILTLSGCVSNRTEHIPAKKISRSLTDVGTKTASELYYFFLENNPKADKATVRKLALLYKSEAALEGINSDCAFIQMCLETGFLTFGNLVTADMHNYCGLGAIDSTHRGERFETEQLGVRAHIQHLHAYATTQDKKLKNECIDNRYKYVVPRGKAKTIYELSGTWATDPNYANKLDRLLDRLETFSIIITK